MALGIILVVVCVMLCAANPMAQTGALVGLLVGVLSGPLRVAAVDFRQWLRDPGEPAEASDDSPYGLARDVFVSASYGAVVFLSFVSLVLPTLYAQSAWSPPNCESVFAPSVGVSRDWGVLATIDLWGIGAFFSDCTGTASQIVRFVLGVGTGVAVVHLLVELVWHLGLVIQPDPAQRRRVLAAEPTPVVLPVINRDGARRRLIVCCDGTWNWPDGKRETNVIRLVRAIAPLDGDIAQMVYYHQGVGTGNILDRMVGGGAGVGLSLSVKGCYGFIVDNYVAGDEIFLFGFSRGAFIARSVAGLIGTVGVLRKSEMERFIEVWDWYSQRREARNLADLAALAPRRYTDVEIECIGVWDTVGALGIPGTRFCAQAFAFYETELGTKVRHAFQALAIDERRANFQAAVWVPFSTQRYAHRAAAQAALPGQPATAAQQPAAQGVPQVLKQVWFPGAHSNIGGGYERHGLSDTTFLWMLAQLHDHRLLALNPREEGRLLALDTDCAVGALDRTEPYPTGTLQNPLTIGWRLISCPVPRPVCLISSAERIYASAWDRVDNKEYPVPRNDAYLRAGRRRWLEAMRAANPTRREEREPFEQQHAVAARGQAPRPPRRVPNNIGFCGELLRLVGGSG
jgi:uncharacterized protein (DUF2235 family)